MLLHKLFTIKNNQVFVARYLSMNFYKAGSGSETDPNGSGSATLLLTVLADRPYLEWQVWVGWVFPAAGWQQLPASGSCRSESSTVHVKCQFS